MTKLRKDLPKSEIIYCLMVPTYLKSSLTMMTMRRASTSGKPHNSTDHQMTSLNLPRTTYNQILPHMACLTILLTPVLTITSSNYLLSKELIAPPNKSSLKSSTCLSTQLAINNPLLSQQKL